MVQMDNVNVYQIVLDAMKSAPVDLEGLARRLGISISHELMPDSISGSIERMPNDSFMIRVNSRHGENRRRFTIAHEIGHFVSHRHLLGKGTNDSMAYRTDRSEAHFNPEITASHETDANRFAAALLMPEELVWDAYLRAKRPKDVTDIAKQFQVSPQAMEIRIKGLVSRK